MHRGRPRIRGIAAALLVAAGLLTAPAGADAVELVGSMHEHSGYSDGWPGSRPADYYASGKGFGLDFMGGSDHSDSLALPTVLSELCAEDPTACLLADPVNPLDSYRKWDATAEQAAAAADAAFTAFRGFEWTSDRFGHLNVYFSQNNTNAKIDGGYLTMEAFWQWLLRDPAASGGADGIGVFNHPGGKKLSEDDPGFNWNDFAYVPAADSRMVGIEVFNDNDDFGSAGPPGGWYVRALDKGWHVGAIGAEDLGHRRTDDWGGPSWPKTVIDSADRTPEELKAALQARRFYAVRDGDLKLDFSVDDSGMGERLARDTGDELKVKASVSDPSLRLDLVTSGGRVLDRAGGELDTMVPASPNDRWYFVRASAAGVPMAYSSPVWVNAKAAPESPSREWLAGDLHVHTCYSHDAYCGPDDDNTGPEELYTAGLPVGARFQEAAARGLDYLGITDHNDVRSRSDPGFGSAGVVGLPAYENSLNGHAQMLGATRVFPKGDGSLRDVQAQADVLRSEGGLLQINHPVAAAGSATDCSPAAGLDWTYGYDVAPDTIEVWNAATPGLADSTRWLECWLERGERVAVTGGSDSHWIATTAIQGVGNPTTWVLGGDRTAAGVLAGIDGGRTSVTRLPPSSGGSPLVIEADPDGDGEFDPAIGDEVPAGTSMRVTGGAPGGGLVRVRANGDTILDDVSLPPGGEVAFTAPDEPGWLRAELRVLPGALQEGLGCESIPDFDFVPCAGDQALAAVTSPVYLRKAAAPGPGPDPDPDPIATNKAGQPKVTVKRKRNSSQRRTCFKVAVSTAEGMPVAGARVELGGKVRTTRADGTARVCRRLARSRTIPLVVTTPDGTTVTRNLTIRKRR